MDSGDEIFITQSSFRKDDADADYDTDAAIDAALQLLDEEQIISNPECNESSNQDTYPHFSDISSEDEQPIASTSACDEKIKKNPRFKEPLPPDVMQDLAKKE